jgi:hypothetical protein
MHVHATAPPNCYQQAPTFELVRIYEVLAASPAAVCHYPWAERALRADWAVVPRKGLVAKRQAPLQLAFSQLGVSDRAVVLQPDGPLCQRARAKAAALLQARALAAGETPRAGASSCARARGR